MYSSSHWCRHRFCRHPASLWPRATCHCVTRGQHYILPRSRLVSFSLTFPRVTSLLTGIKSVLLFYSKPNHSFSHLYMAVNASLLAFPTSNGITSFIHMPYPDHSHRPTSHISFHCFPHRFQMNNPWFHSPLPVPLIFLYTILLE